MSSRLWKGLAWSGLAHALLFFTAAGLVALGDAGGRSIDIDLAGSSLLLRPRNLGGQARPAAPPQPWILASGNRQAPQPKAQPLTATAVPEPEAGPACPPPCPESAGDWMPAAAASRKPAWSEGMIGEEDYPPELRRKGVEGKVVVEVLIDATGAVRGVTLEQGSEPQFNQLVLEKLKQSRFRPAYDQEGNPVACRLRLPLAFRLSN